MTDHRYKDYPTCPRCDYEEAEWYEYNGLKHDEDRIVIWCSRCEYEYEVDMHVTCSFDSSGVRWKCSNEHCQAVHANEAPPRRPGTCRTEWPDKDELPVQTPHTWVSFKQPEDTTDE